MKRQIFPTASKYRRRTRREFGGETVEYIIVILAVVVIGGGLMGFGNQVSGQIGKPATASAHGSARRTALAIMLLAGTAPAEEITPAVKTKAMRVAAHSSRPLPCR